MNRTNLSIVPAPDEEILPTEAERLLGRLNDLKDDVANLRSGYMHIPDLAKLLNRVRYPLWHQNDHLHNAMMSITSLEEINHLEQRADIRFVCSGVSSIRQCGYWPFLPDATLRGGDKVVQRAVLKKVQSVLPMIPGGWKSLGITEVELSRCVTLMPYLHKRYLVSRTLFNIVEMSKLYPGIKRSEFADQAAPATASANVAELLLRVEQREFTFAELYTTKDRLLKTLEHMNNALAKLAP